MTMDRMKENGGEAEPPRRDWDPGELTETIDRSILSEIWLTVQGALNKAEIEDLYEEGEETLEEETYEDDEETLEETHLPKEPPQGGEKIPIGKMSGVSGDSPRTIWDPG